MKDKELFEAIKAEGLFHMTCRLMKDRRASMPSAAIYERGQDPTRNSKLSKPGSYVDPNTNRLVTLKNADPSVHKGSSVIERPLLITSIESQGLDEPEKVELLDDMAELMPVAPAIEAGVDSPNLDDIEPEIDGSEDEAEVESQQAGVSDVD